MEDGISCGLMPLAFHMVMVSVVSDVVGDGLVGCGVLHESSFMATTLFRWLVGYPLGIQTCECLGPRVP